MARPTKRELDLGYCEEAQTYCSVAEERYKQGKEDVLNKLKEYAESRLDMRFALDILCKEVIEEFIAEQLKEQTNDN